RSTQLSQLLQEFERCQAHPSIQIASSVATCPSHVRACRRKRKAANPSTTSAGRVPNHRMEWFEYSSVRSRVSVTRTSLNRIRTALPRRTARLGSPEERLHRQLGLSTEYRTRERTRRAVCPGLRRVRSEERRVSD